MKIKKNRFYKLWPRWLSLVERVTRNLVVVGSNPTRGSTHLKIET